MYASNAARNRAFFNAKHSSNAEPRAPKQVLVQLCREGIPNGSGITLVAYQSAILHAQRRNNGFGRVGMRYSLKKLQEFPHDRRFHLSIGATYFYIAGPCNLTDTL